MGRVRTKNEPVGDIFDVLMTEHRDVEALFDQIEAAAGDDPDQVEDLFTVLEGNLLAHARTEDAVVYTRFAQIDALAEKIGEAREEHSTVESLLAELSGMRIGEAWMNRLTALEEHVQHHVKEEESDIFPIAKDHIAADEAKQLAAAYLQRKARRTGEPELELANARQEARPKPGLLTRLVRMV